MEISVKHEVSNTAAKINEGKNTEDDYSSDGENSVIILDSDTEPEEGSTVSDDQCSEESDEEDEEDEEEEESSNSDESDNSSDSSDADSVWSNIDETSATQNITSEAAEAKVIRKFERALEYITDKNIEKGRKIMLKLLENPILSIFSIGNVNFEEIEDPPRLSKMLQVYIAIHKNLAVIEDNVSVDHYIQVLAYQPNNTQIWMDVALKSFENGDLEFSKYAFQKCENNRDIVEPLATVLYMSCDYKTCLELLKSFEDDEGEMNDKMKYLKYKIRSTNNYYRNMCDRIFEEDEVYTEVKYLDQRKIAVFDERFEELKTRISQKILEKDINFRNEKTLEPIRVEILAEQDLSTICTIFCDLFDRIQCYSSIIDQEIIFEKWENRIEFLDVKNTLEEILDIVECVEDITEMTCQTRKKKKRKSAEYLKTWKKRLFIDTPLDNEDQSGDADIEYLTGDEDDEDNEIGSPALNTHELNLPENELAEEYGLTCPAFDPIPRKEANQQIAPTFQKQELIDEDLVLNEIHKMFESGCWSIGNLISGALSIIGNHSASRGAITDNLGKICIEMYSRLYLCADVDVGEYPHVHIMLAELDHPKAIDFCLRQYFSSDMLTRAEVSKPHCRRLIWKLIHSELEDEVRNELIYVLKDDLEKEVEHVKTVKGLFGYPDILMLAEEMEKRNRIKSIQHLWKLKHCEELIKVIENDINFSSINMDEALELISFWMRSTARLKNWDSFATLAVRVLHFYIFIAWEMFEDTVPTMVQNLIERLRKIDFSLIDVRTTSGIGYFLCVALKKSKKLEENWRNWQCLYMIVRAMRDIPVLEYISTLDRNTDSHALPSPDLDVLAKAHEVLGEMGKCSSEKFEFLLFFVEKIREMFDDIPVLEALFEKENAWIWANLNDEIAQILFCLFGKYSKKKRGTEDHSSQGDCECNMNIARKVLLIILVQPLPLYDDKEKLYHDVVDLINSKFDFLLKISPEKEESVKKFTKILESSSFRSLEDVNNDLNEIRTVVEEEVQALVWYAMALNSYRTSQYEDSRKYAELYLTTSEASYDDRLRASGWAILAHEHVHQLFLLDFDGIFAQWRWRVAPFKLAIAAQLNEAVMHFEFAATLYQLSSYLSRRLRKLPFDDIRRKRIKDVSILREQAKQHFDKCLTLAHPSPDGSPPEFQWLCYFFCGKLLAKEEDINVVRVVECFYEAACGCELAGFYYPIKVSPKKQTNFEPLEVHYQVHAAVWKYLLKTDSPPLEILNQLEAYLRTFLNGHKVVKCNQSLFRCPPEMYMLVSELSDQVVRNVESEESAVIDEMIRRIELVERLEQYCLKAFMLITERFPHFKSHFRLSEIYIKKGSFDLATEQILKNVFRRKKKDDGIFDNIVEISCSDINRAGSFCFHVARCLRMGVVLASLANDLHTLSSCLIALVPAIAYDDEQFVEPHDCIPLVRRIISDIERICTIDHGKNTPFHKNIKMTAVTNGVIRSELWRMWNSISKVEKNEKKLLIFIEKRLKDVITEKFGSVETLKDRIAALNMQETSGRKKGTVKRKTAFDFTKMAEPFLKRVAMESSLATNNTPSSSTANPSTDSTLKNDGIQLLSSSIVTPQVPPTVQQAQKTVLTNVLRNTNTNENMKLIAQLLQNPATAGLATLLSAQLNMSK